jgi:hypothetical protein
MINFEKKLSTNKNGTEHMEYTLVGTKQTKQKPKQAPTRQSPQKQKVASKPSSSIKITFPPKIC